jgi:DNA-binding CsgD family transcriptional regulator/tetratricopeptide (TPR) repeat protein
MAEKRAETARQPELTAATDHRHDLERGRACYARREWDDAFSSLSRADRALPLACEDLERLSFSAALTGRDEQLLSGLERLYQAHVDAGRPAAAARQAFWLGFRLLSLGEGGRATGWLARAQRLVAREGRACVEEGYLLLPVAARQLGSGDYAAAHATAARATEIGERFAESDLAAFARSMEGRALMRQGLVEDGIALLDEAMVAVTSGELSPLVTGLVYCSVIAVCQQVCAFDRAREWTSALAAWCEEQPQLVTFAGTCLVHRAEILLLGGEWREAIEEARRACDRLPPTDAETLADACYQQAEIHRLRGELEAAEGAYRQASQLGREPQPGLALLRLAQGRRDEAVSAIRRVLGTTAPTWRRARFLPACVEILLAVGDLDEARAACRQLEEIAEGFGTEVLGAMAAHARGAIGLAGGDAGGAIEPLRGAFRVWQKVGAPYIAARIRVLIGRACHALGDHDGGDLELDAARHIFTQLGAAPDLAALDEGAGGPGPPPAGGAPPGHGLSRRELQVLRLVASGTTNRTIAGELCLSERTVDRHVSNILTKLGVSSRAAATAFAYQHGLV